MPERRMFADDALKHIDEALEMQHRLRHVTTGLRASNFGIIIGVVLSTGLQLLITQFTFSDKITYLGPVWLSVVIIASMAAVIYYLFNKIESLTLASNYINKAAPLSLGINEPYEKNKERLLEAILRIGGLSLNAPGNMRYHFHINLKDEHSKVGELIFTHNRVLILLNLQNDYAHRVLATLKRLSSESASAR